MIKIPVDLNRLLLHIGRLQVFFEMRAQQRVGDKTDSPMDVATADLRAITAIIETGVKNLDPCDIKK